MRPTCERCEADLPVDALDARICTFECTFCASCADGELAGTCPNCTGELVARPTRPDGARHAGAVLRRYVDAWRAGDLDALLACYAPDFTLHYGGSSRFAGTHAGRDAAVTVMAEVSTVAPRELVSVDDVLLADTGGALVVTERLTRDGEAAVVQRVLHYRVAGDLLAECWLYEADRDVVDRFWR